MTNDEIITERWRIFRLVEARMNWLGVEKFKFVTECIGEKDEVKP